MIAKGINSPLASSAGRLFDAVAAAAGVCQERACHGCRPGAEMDHGAQAGDGRAQLGDEPGVVSSTSNTGPRVAQRVDDLGGRPPGVHRRPRGGTDPPGAEEELLMVVGVEGQDRHPVAGGHAEAAQGAAEAGDAVHHLPRGAPRSPSIVITWSGACCR